MTRRRWTVVALALFLLFAAVTARLYVWPPTDQLGEADVAVLFSGGRGERLGAALEVVEVGGVPALVIPNGTDPAWPDANRLCSGGSGVKVFCPTPEPDTTRGEARVIADLAAEHGWERMVMVTSDYHLTRARLLLSRCFPGNITAIAAQSDLGLGARLTRIGHEWLGMTGAWAFDRGC